MQKRSNAVVKPSNEQVPTGAATKAAGGIPWKKVAAFIAAIGGGVGAVIASSNTSLDLLSKMTAADIDARIVKASFQDRNFDIVEVRVSNPSAKGDSLSEPAFECTTADKRVALRPIWYEPAGESPFPSFPAGSRFPLNMGPTSTIETSVLVSRAGGFQGLRDCQELRFSWLDAHHKRQHGPAVKIPPGTPFIGFIS
ncbi:hypothetical protein SNE35_09670 [Paucibacter sp. R3-3]|uniref:Uncharacterized protein n=1 Tax=Roseateles agri TaxID=3098619 RepID=A0ABU5DI29_9BURK|nr:hypothetical protein [Paucibacter sp. R3-3]MDY0744777.1 hypothetical protein [Paucibacter sp. R3-3]